MVGQYTEVRVARFSAERVNQDGGENSTKSMVLVSSEQGSSDTTRYPEEGPNSVPAQKCCQHDAEEQSRTAAVTQESNKSVSDADFIRVITVPCQDLQRCQDATVIASLATGSKLRRTPRRDYTKKDCSFTLAGGHLFDVFEDCDSDDDSFGF
mmetsp:Transcript_55105/g.165053  ORF Transcript_55105/g.165053 Transcript_55105/m.165053 type:complete len:153 (-) Transcript_55105:78-536(-)